MRVTEIYASQVVKMESNLLTHKRFRGHANGPLRNRCLGYRSARARAFHRLYGVGLLLRDG